MKASSELSRLSVLALRQRRQGLTRLPPVAEILRGSLMERYVTCGNPSCKCARGERHGPVWYLSVTLGPGRTTGAIIPEEKVDEVRGWIENYQKLKDQLEKISEINRELLRRERAQQRKAGRKE
ncbi:MAG TPA: DUF6788 family protein [Bryobacteraceae bacterium]|nr:DUF6788 family protein [Bryobacteraceae bacterium]